jgi:hypothetical protein
VKIKMSAYNPQSSTSRARTGAGDDGELARHFTSGSCVLRPPKTEIEVYERPEVTAYIRGPVVLPP